MVLILSDGANTSGNQLSFEDAVRALAQSEVSVFAVHFNARWKWKRVDVLSRYARETGGDVFNPKDLATLDPLPPPRIVVTPCGAQAHGRRRRIGGRNLGRLWLVRRWQ